MTLSPGRWRLACLAVLTCCTAATAAAPTVPARPNILLILADDLGYSDLGCYGGEIRTPHIDALAKNGLRFTQFYNCARCCPSRASLMTGLYPHQAGVGLMTTDRGKPGYRGFLQPNTVTLAELLKSAGYRTLMCGKWHLSLGPAGRPPRSIAASTTTTVFWRAFAASGTRRARPPARRPSGPDLPARQVLRDRRLHRSRAGLSAREPQKSGAALLSLPGLHRSALPAARPSGRHCPI